MQTPREKFETIIKESEFTGQKYAVVKIENLRQLLEEIDKIRREIRPSKRQGESSAISGHPRKMKQTIELTPKEVATILAKHFTKELPPGTWKQQVIFTIKDGKLQKAEVDFEKQ